MYDLIVVGGSAIGLYLAIEFRKKGWSVLVLEKKKEIGGKICSGLVSKHLFEIIGIRKEEIKKQNFFEKRFSGARIWIENTPFDFAGLAYLINRRLFEEYLFKKAKESGVEIKLGEEVEKVLEKENSVEVSTKSKKTFQGRILAGCDGFLSKTAGELGFSKPKRFLVGIMSYFQYPENSIGNSKNNLPELFFSRQFPGFFAWKIPRLSCVEYGLALEPKYKVKEVFEKWLKSKIGKNGNLGNISNPTKYTKYTNFTKHTKNTTYTNLTNFQSAPIPLSPIKRTVLKRVFLCGDAAGQIKPYSGGGLVYGLTCAKIASEVINPQNPNLTLYEKQWRKKLMKDILIGRAILNCYRLPNFVKKLGLSFLQNKKNLDQDKPSRLF